MSTAGVAIETEVFASFHFTLLGTVYCFLIPKDAVSNSIMKLKKYLLK